MRNILICLLLDIVFPAYTIYKLQENIPDFFSKSNAENKDTRPFFVRKPTILPRRDLKYSEILQLKSIQWSSMRTERCFLTNTCNCGRCVLASQKAKIPNIIVTSEKMKPKIIFVKQCNENNSIASLY